MGAQTTSFKNPKKKKKTLARREYMRNAISARETEYKIEKTNNNARVIVKKKKPILRPGSEMGSFLLFFNFFYYNEPPRVNCTALNRRKSSTRSVRHGNNIIIIIVIIVADLERPIFAKGTTDGIICIRPVPFHGLLNLNVLLSLLLGSS